MDAENQEYCSTDNEEEGEEEAEPPLDQLIHSREMLQKVLVLVPEAKKLMQNPKYRKRLIGCLMICNIGKEKKLIDEIELVSNSEIKFKHSRKAFLVQQLQYAFAKISNKEFSQWIEQMAAWDELLPSFAVYKNRRNQVSKSLKEKKQDKEDKNTSSINEEKEEEEEKRTKRKRKRVEDEDEEEGEMNEKSEKNPKMATTSKGESSNNNPQMVHQDKLKLAFGEDLLKILMQPGQLIQLNGPNSMKVLMPIFFAPDFSKFGWKSKKRSSNDNKFLSPLIDQGGTVNCALDPARVERGIQYQSFLTVKFGDTPDGLSNWTLDSIDHVLLDNKTGPVIPSQTREDGIVLKLLPEGKAASVAILCQDDGQLAFGRILTEKGIKTGDKISFARFILNNYSQPRRMALDICPNLDGEKHAHLEALPEPDTVSSQKPKELSSDLNNQIDTIHVPGLGNLHNLYKVLATKKSIDRTIAVVRVIATLCLLPQQYEPLWIVNKFVGFDAAEVVRKGTGAGRQSAAESETEEEEENGQQPIADEEEEGNDVRIIESDQGEDEEEEEQEYDNEHIDEEEEDEMQHRDEMEAEYDEEDEEEPEEEEAHMEPEIETTPQPPQRKRVKLEPQDDDDVQIVQPSSTVEAPLRPTSSSSSSLVIQQQEQQQPAAESGTDQKRQATVVFTESEGDKLWMRFFFQDTAVFSSSRICTRDDRMKPGMWAQIEFHYLPNYMRYSNKAYNSIAITNIRPLDDGSTNSALNWVMRTVQPANTLVWETLLKMKIKPRKLQFLLEKANEKDAVAKLSTNNCEMETEHDEEETLDDDVEPSTDEASLTLSHHPTSSTPSSSKLLQATVLFTEFVGDDLWMRFFEPDTGTFQHSYCSNRWKIKTMKPGIWAKIEYHNFKGGPHISITRIERLNGSTNTALNTAMCLVIPTNEGIWTLLLKTRRKQWSVPDLLAAVIVGKQANKNLSSNSNSAPSLPSTSTPKRRPSTSSETASNTIHSHGVKADESPKLGSVKRPMKVHKMEDKETIKANIEAKLKKKLEASIVREMFKETFGEELLKILVTPRQLIQLLQLGHEEFKRIASGLFVRFMMFDKGTKKSHLSLGQIRTVSFDSRPYTVYDQELNVKLHLENSNYWFTIAAVRFGEPGNEKQLLGQPKLIESFTAPTAEFVGKKWGELKTGLNKTVPPKGRMYHSGPKAESKQ